MSGPQEVSLENLVLPWSFTRYQVLSVIAFVPSLIIAVLGFLSYSDFHDFLSISFLLFLVFLMTGLSLYFCSKLRRGKVPRFFGRASFRRMVLSSPRRIHRFLISGLFMEVGVNAWFVKVLPIYSANYLIAIPFLISLMIGFYYISNLD